MTAPSDAEVTDLARHIAQLGSKSQSNVFKMSFWNERLLAWSMKRPEFKAQLFRFVDVFPATTTNKDVLEHAQEYLSGDSVPGVLRRALSLAGAMPGGAAITASQARRNIARMADQFILGTTASEAVSGTQSLWNHGSGTVVDLLGEKTVTEQEADSYGARVLEIMNALCDRAPKWKQNEIIDRDDFGPLPRVSIAIKPTALASRYTALTHEEGLRQAKERIRPILRLAKQRDVLVWFDAEHFEVKDMTQQLYRELLDEDEFKDLVAGIVVQAYLRDSYSDLADLIAWGARRALPPFIRLVKGAYWDTETMHADANDWATPVFSRKVESDANYERCARLLLDHHGQVRAAFASHNLRSLSFAIAYARNNGLPDNSFEIQMLYGMAEPMHEAIRRLGLRHRVYAPVGELVPGMSYLVRRLLENTSNESFVRMRFAEGRQLDELVAPPNVDSLPDAGPPAERQETEAQSPSFYLPEPPAEWHRDEVRQRMAKAVGAQVPSSTPYVAALIDGQRVRTEASITSENPARPSDIVAISASCTVEHARQAIESADKAFPAWAKTPARERAGILFKAAQWMRSRRFELAAIQVREAGKPWFDADGDICEAIDFCEYYGREMIRLDAGGPVQSTAGETNRLLYEPRGVGVVIAPWNFPLAIPTGMVVAALVTGNTVVFKPSEQTPAIANALVEALLAAGLPKNVLQFLPGDGEAIGPTLVEHPTVSFVAFTGSKPVGLSIVEQTAVVQPGQRHIKRVIAELGGKNPMIVASDADLDAAVPAIMYSAFGFSGQKCSALSRLIVLDAVKEQLVDRLAGAVATLQVGEPLHEGIDMGPVVDAESQRRIINTIHGAPQHGTIRATRTDMPGAGYFVPPTIVDNVNPESSLAKEEIFGPVLSVFGAADIDDALMLANSTDYALTAGVFSRSPSVIDYVSRNIRAGNVYINRTTTGAVVGRQPFGGWGLSGLGTKAGGPDYLLHFMNPRVITENVVRQGFAALS